MQKLKTSKEIRVVVWAITWFFFLLIMSELIIAKGWPWRLSGLEPYVLRYEGDNWTHNAFEIQRIKQRQKSGANSFFVFVAGSVGLEAIDSDESMSAKTGEFFDKRITFKSLCASYGTFADHAKIIRELGAFGGTVLIGIEPLAFKARLDQQLENRRKTTHTHNKNYFLTPPPGIVDILSSYGYETRWKHRLHLFRTAQAFGEMLKNKAGLFLRNRGRINKVVHDRHVAGKGMPPVKEEDREKQIKIIENIFKRYQETYKFNLDLLKETINIANDNFNKIILVDMPGNPLYEKQIAMFNPQYDEMISKLIEETGVGYFDMRYAAKWSPEDFRDIHHMRSPGAEKFTEVLALKLSESLKLSQQ